MGSNKRANQIGGSIPPLPFIFLLPIKKKGMEVGK